MQTHETVFEELVVVLFVFGAHVVKVLKRQNEHLVVVIAKNGEHSSQFLHVINPQLNVGVLYCALLEYVNHAANDVGETEKATLAYFNVLCILVLSQNKSKTARRIEVNTLNIVSLLVNVLALNGRLASKDRTNPGQK